MPSIRVGLLGAGYIASYHVEALRSVPNTSVLAVCDTNRGRAETAARAFGIPEVYSDLAQMLRQTELDAVHVLLPPPAHANATIQILEAGVDAFVEKPVCLTAEELVRMQAAADKSGRKLGVAHNFLFAKVYEKLSTDIAGGRLGRIERLDVVWNKELGQVRFGPFDQWLLAKPENVLFEVGPHIFAYVAHLLGPATDWVVKADDRVTLPGNRLFARRWEALANAGSAAVRLWMGFGGGYSEHFVAVRGSSGTAVADLENDTYVVYEHTAQMLDLDRMLTVSRSAAHAATQSVGTFSRFVFAKLGMLPVGTPYGASIARAVQAFYDGRAQGELDPRIGAALGGVAVALATEVARVAALPAPVASVAEHPPAVSAAPTAHPEVLVLGGTGFIGRALVRKLREAGHGVRLVARNPGAVPGALRALGLDIVRGDLSDPASLAAALDGIRYVYHLARGVGNTWDEYLSSDVEPTRRFAELALERGVRGFYYASSIAIYYAGARAGTINEDTPPHPGILRANPYARSKVENERNLLELHRSRGLPLVIFRPGIVLGSGGSPLHWGIAAWPYPSVSRLWGDGRSPLPIVLVDDCAEGMVKAVGRDDLSGQSFNLVGEACLTAQDYLNELERSSGVKVRRVPTSSVRYFAEEFAKYLIKSAGRDPHVRMPSFADWEGRNFRATFDASRARELLGWSPTSDRGRVVREGIEAPAREFLS